MGTPKLRGAQLSSRPFYATVLMLSLLTAYSFLAHTHTHARDQGQGHGHGHDHDNLSILKRKQKLECREVHSASDQCAFVKKYCQDENAGLIPYLTLYYCNMHHAQALSFAILVSWLGLLFTTIGIAASDFFSVNLSTIATILGLSESLAGVTFLAFGNGSPDVFSTFAAMGSNSASMAYGELIGAASFITGVVAGSMALVREFKVDKKTYARDIGFFIVAVGFTMVFLIDGELHLWECAVMVGYYIIYVATVVCWHWYTTTRRTRLRREGEARSHVYGTVNHTNEELAGEPYRDDPDDIDAATNRSFHDISVLEAGPRVELEGQPADLLEQGRAEEIPVIVSDNEEDDEETNSEHNKLVAAEVASSMRVLRNRGRRSNTITPIRPSLVGALEFRSALAHLQRESNLQLSQIPGRSYSEALLSHHARVRSETTQFGGRAAGHHSVSALDGHSSRRHRAHSSGSMPLSPSHGLTADDRRHRANSELSLPQPLIAADPRTPSPAPSYTVGGNLAPPPGLQVPGPPAGPAEASLEVPAVDGRLHLEIPSRRSSYSERSPPMSPFPNYTDSPLVMTPNVQSERVEFLALPGPSRQDSGHFADLQVPVEPPRPVAWWPYSVLPAPHVLLTTLFPTLQGWKEKAYWDKFVSLISVPSIFLLVITLPVVESETTEDSSILDSGVDGTEHRGLGFEAAAVSTEHQAIEPESEWQRYRRRTISRDSSRHRDDQEDPRGRSGLRRVDTPEIMVEGRGRGKPASELQSTSNADDEGPAWNRWLVSVQVFTGPLFAVLILWANMAEDFERPGRTLVTMMLWALLGSLLSLLVLVTLTTEDKRPKYQYLLCFLGFIISIAWISTIAGEVVGVLKTVGVVLGISDALLGLTIFAAGNSIGDLIADITVARLGYPVMAL
jgi:sodium/potassium/calcium exchanger 6